MVYHTQVLPYQLNNDWGRVVFWGDYMASEYRPEPFCGQLSPDHSTRAGDDCFCSSVEMNDG